MKMPKKFQRTIESFTCLHCSNFIEGNGYTNHCPECLWSRHVDNNPGDRAAACQGLMEPVAVQMQGGKQIITHRCLKCSLERKNKAAEDDCFEQLLIVAANAI